MLVRPGVVGAACHPHRRLPDQGCPQLRHAAATTRRRRSLTSARYCSASWRTRSPSQCPGTARSAASAGRSLIITSRVMNFPLSFGSLSLSGRSPAALVTHARRMICRRASLISARPTARADTSACTPGAQVDRLAPLHSAAPGHARTATHSLASRLIRVFSGAYSWFHLQCVFGVFSSRERVASVDDLSA
jgi:hypothetical protein